MFGGGSKTRSFVSLLSLIGLSISTVLTMLGIMKESKSTAPNQYWAPEYVVPGSVLNGLTVLFLLYLVSTAKGKTNFYKLVVIFLLVAGLAAEIYMTTLLDMTNVGQQVGTWIVVVLNWLFRAFFILEYVQEEWSPLFPTTKDVAKAISGPAASSSSSGSTDFRADLRKKLDEYVKRLREKLEKDGKKDSSGNKITVRYFDAQDYIKNTATSASDFGKVKDLVKLSDGSKAMSYLQGGRR